MLNQRFYAKWSAQYNVSLEQVNQALNDLVYSYQGNNYRIIAKSKNKTESNILQDQI